MERQLTLSVETSDPKSYDSHFRWASIKVNGVTIFSELVYDAEPGGSRSAEQAERNILDVFASRLRQLLEG